MIDVLAITYEAQIKAEQAQQPELEEALRQARSEIYRLKDLVEKTECERDTSIANAMKRIEQLEENHINSIVDLSAANMRLEQTINELRSHG